MMMTSNILACSTCRVNMIEAGGDAAGWSIFFLLVVILGLLVGVGLFMFNLVRLEKENLDPALSDDYIPSDS